MTAPKTAAESEDVAAGGDWRLQASATPRRAKLRFASSGFAAELDALKSRAPLLALYLKSETCGPCHAVLPIAERAFGAAPWELAVVDQAEAPELFGQLLVFTVPTLILYIEGQELRRFSRFIPEAELSAAKARAEELIAAPPL